MAVAELGYMIDSSGAVKAEQDLDGMTAAAMRAEAGQKKLATASKVASTQAGQFAKATGASTGQVANLGAQLNDIGVMLAAGQSPLQLAVQQGTQINQVFAQMGGGRAALQGLAAGFMSMVNPMSLATIGIIAGGAALVQWGMSAIGAGDDAATLEDRLADLDAAMSDIEAYDFDNSLKGMHVSAVAIKDEFRNILAVVNEVQATALENALIKLREQSGLAEAISKNMAAASVAAQIGADAPPFEFMDLGSLNQGMFVLKSIQGIEGDTREEILKSLEATTERLRLRGLLNSEVKAYLADVATQLGLEQLITDEAKDQNDAINDASDATFDWSVQMVGVRSELNAIAAIIASLGGGAITAAAKRTEIAALQAGNSVKDAAKAAAEFQENLKVDAQIMGLESRFGKVGTAIGSVLRGQIEYNRELNAQLEAEREITTEREKAEAMAARIAARSSGGGRATADPYKADLEALIESLRTERETIDAWYMESDALLNDRRATELLTAQEHNAAKLALEAEYSARLVDIKQQEAQMVKTAAAGMYGELGSLLSSFGEKSRAAAVAALAVNTALRISEVIQNTAAAAVRALAELGPIAGPPAAAKIMAFGKVQAGLIAANAVLSSGSRGGGGGGSLGGSGAPSAQTTEAAPMQRAIIQINGNRSRFTIDEINDIIMQLQKEAKDGVIIEGFVAT